MNKLKIKICGMTEWENISRILEIRPDYLGFIFYPRSPRFVSSLNLVEIADFPGNVVKVGVFVNADKTTIINLARSWGLGLIQLHGDETTSFCRNLQEEGLKIIKVFNISEYFDFSVLEEYMPFCDYFLFDTKTNLRGGSGVKFNWELLNAYKLDHPFFLSGGIQLSDAKIIKQFSHPSLYGVDVNSGFEVSPGIKDVVRLVEFINVLRKDK